MSSGSRRRRQTLRRPPRRHDNAGLRRRLERLHRELTLEELKRRYGKSACFRCGARKDLTIDHVVPRSQGGPDDIDNYQILCWDCNQKKAASCADYRQRFSDVRSRDSRSRGRS